MVYSEQYIFKSSYHISSSTQDKLTKTTTCIIEKLKPRDVISPKKSWHIGNRQMCKVGSGFFNSVGATVLNAFSHAISNCYQSQ